MHTLTDLIDSTSNEKIHFDCAKPADRKVLVLGDGYLGEHRLCTFRYTHYAYLELMICEIKTNIGVAMQC